MNNEIKSISDALEMERGKVEGWKERAEDAEKQRDLLTKTVDELRGAAGEVMKWMDKGIIDFAEMPLGIKIRLEEALSPTNQKASDK